MKVSADHAKLMGPVKDANLNANGWKGISSGGMARFALQLFFESFA